MYEDYSLRHFNEHFEGEFNSYSITAKRSLLKSALRIVAHDWRADYLTAIINLKWSRDLVLMNPPSIEN
ncbi:MAG TPA: hypothetical protein DGG95_00380 [Cytophagales bacterium]|nr:hypothetical protein [Cytophagales bacterium]